VLTRAEHGFTPSYLLFRLEISWSRTGDRE